MNQTLFASLIAIGLALIGVIADAFLKKAGAGRNDMDIPWFIAGCVAYASTVFGWFYVMKTLKLSTVGVLYGVSSVLFLTLAGLLFFGEHLKAAEWIGILFAVTSIILLARFA